MRYKIEYLRETTEEDSVCHTKVPYDAKDLDAALVQAWAGALGARREFRANGFQIRDMHNGGKIVAIETFDNVLPFGR